MLYYQLVLALKTSQYLFNTCTLPTSGSSCDEMEQPNKGGINFLTIPPEIRTEIYILSLVAHSPIIVWSARYIRGFRLLRVPRRLEWDHEAMASSVRNLALSLLRCNRTVAPEVASIFYGKNIFSFHGDHEYLAVIGWLGAIGEKNRGYVTQLEVSVQIPSRAWQRRSGGKWDVFFDGNISSGPPPKFSRYI